MTRADSRQRLDHALDPLARTEQPERGQHDTAGEAAASETR
jgi:hypothetical protein